MAPFFKMAPESNEIANVVLLAQDWCRFRTI